MASYPPKQAIAQDSDHLFDEVVPLIHGLRLWDESTEAPDTLMGQKVGREGVVAQACGFHTGTGAGHVIAGGNEQDAGIVPKALADDAFAEKHIFIGVLCFWLHENSLGRHPGREEYLAHVSGFAAIAGICIRRAATEEDVVGQPLSPEPIGMEQTVRTPLRKAAVWQIAVAHCDASGNKNHIIATGQLIDRFCLWLPGTQCFIGKEGITEKQQGDKGNAQQLFPLSPKGETCCKQEQHPDGRVGKDLYDVSDEVQKQGDYRKRQSKTNVSTKARMAQRSLCMRTLLIFFKEVFSQVINEVAFIAIEAGWYFIPITLLALTGNLFFHNFHIDVMK